MIKHLILPGLVILTIAWMARPGEALARSADPRAALLRAVGDLLPAGCTAPERLPAAIRDPLLLAGWVCLYNQQEPLPAWDGTALSGRTLAQYVLDHNVQVRWNTRNECGGDSCAPRPVCKAAPCPAPVENSRPILVTTWYREHGAGHLPRLAGTLAHEIFHHMLPFGSVEDTLYEEYWAYAAGAWVFNRERLDANGYNPKQSACLVLWFNTYQPERYAGLPSYPAAVVGGADTVTPTCAVTKRLPGEVDGFPGGTGD